MSVSQNERPLPVLGDRCPAQRPLQADAAPPCLTCVRRPRCFTHWACRRLFEAGGGQKLFLISSCGDYQPRVGAAAEATDIRPSLRQVGAEHLCADCPAELQSGCSLHHDLAELEFMARFAEQSKMVGFTVFSCRERATPFVAAVNSTTEVRHVTP